MSIFISENIKMEVLSMDFKFDFCKKWDELSPKHLDKAEKHIKDFLEKTKKNGISDIGDVHELLIDNFVTFDKTSNAIILDVLESYHKELMNFLNKKFQKG